MNDLSAITLAQVYASASRETVSTIRPPFPIHENNGKSVKDVPAMTANPTDNPKTWKILTATSAWKVLQKTWRQVGPPSAPFFHSKNWLGTSKIADLASVPGPVAAVSLLPGVSAMRFLQRARHGASPSGRFAAGGASPAVLWLRGAPPSSTHGPNEEANAVMTPPWWMEKRETFPHKNGRPPHGLLSNKHI